VLNFSYPQAGAPRSRLGPLLPVTAQTNEIVAHKDGRLKQNSLTLFAPARAHSTQSGGRQSGRQNSNAPLRRVNTSLACPLESGKVRAKGAVGAPFQASNCFLSPIIVILCPREHERVSHFGQVGPLGGTTVAPNHSADINKQRRIFHLCATFSGWRRQ